MTPGLAKTTRPALTGVVPRTRLFRRVDEALRRCGVVWLDAPAGSGKTTLAASWVQARRKPCLWYQMDGRDADPASFFYYLREEVGRIAPRKVERLPLLTPEYAAGLEAYARGFFEQVGARLRPGTLLVLDDFHELPADSPLHALMPIALSSLPGTVRVLVASRAAPPPAFARLLANSRVGRLEGEALNLSAAEIVAIARRRGDREINPRDAAALRDLTGGWTAGTLLLLERGAGLVPGERDENASARDLLFDYFAAELFDRAPERTRRFLLETSLLPRVGVAGAVALTGERDAQEILAGLVRQNWFTVRLAGGEPTFRYHPLFRRFLLSRAPERLGAERWLSLARRAAEVLIREGTPEDAGSLLVQAGDHEGVAELVLAAAPVLARQGRLLTVEGWLRALPPELLERSPWLSYWLGVCRSAFSPLEARAHFDVAFRAFELASDTTGMLLAWAGVANTFFYVWGDFTPLDGWIGRMEQLWKRNPSFPSPEVEAEVTFGMMSALMWRQPDHPAMPEWLGRAKAMLRARIPAELRMRIAAYLVFHRLWWDADPAAAGALLEEMRPWLSAPDVTASTEILWLVMDAAFHARVANGEACFEAVERGLARAEGSGVLGLNHTLLLQGAYGGLSTGDLALATRYLERGRTQVGAHELTYVAHTKLLLAWVALARDDVEEAARYAAEFGELAPACGVGMAPAWHDAMLAHVRLAEGDHDGAFEAANRALAWARRASSSVVEHHALLTLAFVELDRGRAGEAVPFLREATACGKQRGYVTSPWIGWRRPVAARLAAFALEHDIEPDHVRALVRANRLSPPEGAGESWPWPVRIRTLGAFELWRDGARVVFPRKVQRKPLELLQALVAFGGESVREEALSEALWPDADGDAARHALETTLYRLRRLLGAPEAILQSERRLSINPAVCWVDALRLPVAISAALSSMEPAAALSSLAARVVRLYGGPFLGDSLGEHPWAARARERLRRELRRCLESPGEAMDGGEGTRSIRAHVERVDPEALRPVLRSLG